MRTGGLLTRRARAQGGLLVLAGVLAAVACAVVVAIVGHLDVAARSGLVTALREAPATSAATRFTTTLSGAPDEQDAAARRILAQRLGRQPVDVHRSARSEPLPLVPGGAAAGGDPAGERGATSVADDALEVTIGTQEPGLVVTSAGTWPTDAPDAVAVPAGLATSAGLAVGDALALGAGDDARPFVVAAVYEPRDVRDPAWFDEAEGGADPVAHPVLVAGSALGDAPQRVRVHWTVVPDLDRVRPADLARLRTALEGTRAVLHEDDDVMVLGVTATGGLGGLLASTDADLAAARGVSVPAAALTALVVVLTFGQASRMLVDARRPETVLVRSRGTTRAAVVGASAIEGALVTSLGAVLGAVVGGTLVTATAGSSAPSTVVAGGVLAVVVVGTATLATAAWQGTADGRAETRRRAVPGSLAAGALTLLAGTTALAVWRLTDRGSPVRVDAAGRAVLDPLAAGALPLALVLVALLAATLPGPVAGLLARAASRRRTLDAVLAARQVARRPLAHATAATFVALTVATTVVAAAFTGSWHAHARDRADAAVGADIRLDLGRDPMPGGAGAHAAQVATVPGVTAAAPARVDRTAIGSIEGRTVALPPAGRAALPVAGAASLADALASGAADGLPLPASATRLDVEVTPTAGDPGGDAPPVVGAVAWVASAPGTLTPLALARDTRRDTWTAPLPAGGTAWRVLAVDVAPRGAAGYGVAVTRVTTDAGDGAVGPGDVPWTAWQLAPTPVALDVAQGRADVPRRVAARASTAPVRLTPGAVEPLPVALGASLATALDLGTGGTTTVRVAGADLPVTVAAVVPVVPGSGHRNALLADLDGIEAALLRGGVAAPPAVHEVWVDVATARPDTLVAAVVDALSTPPHAVATAAPPPAPLLRPALTLLAAAAAATALLAVGGLAVSVRAADRRRSADERVLLALGVAPARQARARSAELGATVLLAAVAGALGGAAVARLTVATLVGATSGTTPDVPPLAVASAVDAGALAALLAVSAAGAAAVLVVSAVGVRARATGVRA
ncbi:MAG: hypothetical protein IR158_09625 [Cellulomonas sp.]|uniref:hypothetical protein n=1 Tax=Cellulomonas sp. TaxID=40001 RepID=UPI0019FFCD28|nr:hypothetical protein [Cellulomonas sp.]MBF0688009.1 hypothetical protein [Cellulomonas sp.]